MKCYSDYIPKKIIPNISIEEDIELVIDEIVHDKVFEKSVRQRETYQSIDLLKYCQD